MGHRGVKKPILFTTLGYTGSGKTFFARRFARDFGLFHFNSDRVRSEIYSVEKHMREEDNTVLRVMDFIADELLGHMMQIRPKGFIGRVYGKWPRSGSLGTCCYGLGLR